jgi:hypothetical protein
MDYRRACLWLAFVLGGGLAVAQQPTKGTVPRTVRVYVLVTTASGRPVTDLRAQDFSLWDNNVLQKRVTSFRLIRVNSSHLPQMAFVSTEPQTGHDSEVLAYELTFDAPVAARTNEYHSLGVKVDRQKLNVLAPQGYYAQP